MKWPIVVAATVGCALPCARGRAAIAASELPRVTLVQALAYAREHRPELHAERAHVASVEAQADVVRAHWYPAFGATAQALAATTNNTTASYLPSAYFDNPRVSATRAESPSTASMAPSGSTLLGVGLRQELFDFGRLAARAAAEDLRADAERSTLAGRRLAVDYDVEESYFAVYAAKSILAAAQAAVQRSVAHRDMARAGVDSGLRRPIELTRAEAVVDRYDLEELDGRRGVTEAESALAAAVGAPGPLLDIEGSPPAPGELPDLSESFAEAKVRNPELHAALARIRAVEMQTRAVRAEARPNVSLTAAISASAGGAAPSSGVAAPAAGWLPTVPNWDVGVVLSWPLFDETVAARTKESRFDEESARADAEATSLHLVAQVQQAFAQLEAARDRLPVLKQALDAAVANYDQANARFGVGLSNAIELADAEDLRTEADIQLALGTFELARARAALARAVAEGL
jgi:outer membrane protein TolC